MEVVLIYWGAIALLILIVCAAYPGWKVLPLAILWPIVGAAYICALLVMWFLKPLKER